MTVSHVCYFFLWLLMGLLATSGCLASKISSHTPQERFATEQQRLQPRVFINSLPRSGSTFIGNLFLQNPESAYLYEATRLFGKAFWNDKCAPQPDANISNIFTQMMLCNYAPMKKYLEEKSSAYTGDKKFLMSWEHIKENSAAEKCKASEPFKVMMATKEIVMWSPKFRWMLNAFNGNLRIIWLVRDIRGFVSSWMPFMEDDKRENMYLNWKYNTVDFWKLYESCSWKNESQKDLELIKLLSDLNAPPYKRMAAWWIMEQKMMINFLSEIPQEYWMLVRYEDLSLYPVDVTQQIYSFLGKNVVHEDVIKWVLKSTSGGSDTEWRYGTQRDGSKMSKAYLDRIPKDILMDIERMTGPLMDYFGYKSAIVNATTVAKTPRYEE